MSASTNHTTLICDINLDDDTLDIDLDFTHLVSESASKPVPITPPANRTACYMSLDAFAKAYCERLPAEVQAMLDRGVPPAALRDDLENLAKTLRIGFTD